MDRLIRSVSLLIGANSNSPPSLEAPLFPLKSMHDFQKAEDQLQSDEQLANYVSFSSYCTDFKKLLTVVKLCLKSGYFYSKVKTFSRIGGTSETKIVNNICSYIFSHELAQSIRLTASSGKKAIDNTRLLQLICGKKYNLKLID